LTGCTPPGCALTVILGFCAIFEDHLDLSVELVELVQRVELEILVLRLQVVFQQLYS
jgi:hypothetical protein